MTQAGLPDETELRGFEDPVNLWELGWQEDNSEGHIPTGILATEIT